MTIKSKIHTPGHENESEWPSQYGTGEKGRIVYGDVYKPKIYGQAPIAIMDSMPKTYHEGVCRDIESRKEWELADKMSGCITFGNKEQAKIKVDAANERKKYKAELRKASLEALTEYKQNPKQMSQRLAKKAELQREVARKTGMESLIKENINGRN